MGRTGGRGKPNVPSGAIQGDVAPGTRHWRPWVVGRGTGEGWTTPLGSMAGRHGAKGVDPSLPLGVTEGGSRDYCSSSSSRRRVSFVSRLPE